MLEFNLTSALVNGLSQIHKKIENVSKNKEGYNYRYAELSQLTELINPLLGEAGLSFTQFPNTSKTNDNGGIIVSVTSLLASEDGGYLKDFISMEVDFPPHLSKAQSIGAVITYARRYSIASIFNIAQEDNDASKKPVFRDKERTFFKMFNLINSIDNDEVRDFLLGLNDRSLIDVCQKYEFDKSKLIERYFLHKEKQQKS